jgi:hypothetical protein
LSEGLKIGHRNPGPRDISSEKSLHKIDKYFLLRLKWIKRLGLCNDEQDHFGNWHL